ncbi:hypothetical protein [Vibrio bathopelagicus]
MKFVKTLLAASIAATSFSAMADDVNLPEISEPAHPIEVVPGNPSWERDLDNVGNVSINHKDNIIIDGDNGNRIRINQETGGVYINGESKGYIQDIR